MKNLGRAAMTTKRPIRVKARYKVLLELENKLGYMGTISNISEAGLFLSTQNKASESEIGKIGSLYLLPKTPGFCKTVRIVRITDDGVGLVPSK